MNLEPIADSPPVTLAPRDDKARRRSNAAPTYRLPFTAESLEAGVDLETLLALPVPVFTYATQITIHGILADFQPGLVSTYKHLTRNQNGSLGVRWGAIDAGKKHHLRDSIRWLRSDTDGSGTPWYATHNSKGTTITRTVETVAEGRAVIAALPSGIYGSACLMRCVMSGTIFADVSVGAIALDSLWTVISHFAPGYTSEAILAARVAAYTEERLRKEAEHKAARADTRRRHQARRAIIKSLLDSHLRTWRDWKPAPGHLVRITEGGINEPKPVIIHLEKRGPRLCLIGRNGKGTVLTNERIATYREDSATGHLYHYDPARIPAITAAMDALDAAGEASVTPQPPKVEAPAPAMQSALDLF